MGNRSAAAAAWLGLGRSSLALGREAQALLALRRARTEHRRLNQWGGAGEAAEALALAALRAGRLEEAEAWVRDARRAHRKGQSRAGQARVLSLAGALAALRGDLSAGARRVRRALGGLRVLERRLEAYVQLGRVGALSLMQGDLGKALRMLEQTRGRGARLRSLGLELSGQLGLVLALARSGFGELALQGLERCASMAGRCEDAWLARVVVAARREVSEASAGSGVARVEGEQASMLDAAEGLLLWA
jgi:tetratricopeptide (TPR) repeat protein